MPPRHFITTLVEADRRSRSWREKLEAIQTLLAGSDGSDFDLQQLVDLAVYARFLATGEIPCTEDGRHFRPVHHSRLAQEIEQRLAELSKPGWEFIVRRILPCLPSTAQAFQTAEPLTRIRDIAHRNDIPSELKREIKESLQNKLHRCAGPEDLATSKNLLARITAPEASYSPAFIEQFRIFHRELEEFFNAQSLGERLHEIALQQNPECAAAIEQFLDLKSGRAEPLVLLRSLTQLRGILARTCEGKALSASQPLVLADIALEDYAFALLSELANRAEPLLASRETDVDWSKPLEVLRLSILNVAFSGISPEEGKAIENELQAWSVDFNPHNRHDGLRLKATIERAQRLAESFADRLIALYPQEASRVGRALGVAEHAIRVFGEAEVRRHVIFQASKLASLLLRRLRATLGTSEWDVLVSGKAVGYVRALDSVAALGVDPQESVIALVNRAEGDEEIPAGTTAVVLAHSIPHLSHLGVRARQAKVVFVCCEVPETLQALRQYEGRKICLEAASDSVRWEAVADNEASPQATPVKSANRAGRPDHQRATMIDRSVRRVVPVDKVSAEIGGPKAFGARRLAELSRQQDSGFKTPPSAVITFGVMQAAWEAAQDCKSDYDRIVAQIDSAAPHRFMQGVEQLAGVVSQLRLPKDAIPAVIELLPDTPRLMVRSSSNCEDLDNTAGAGLYDSVPNVPRDQIEDAVRTVWSSLWTRRAALDRQHNGVRHAEASMAVLVQAMLAADYSFVLHTANPLDSNARQVYLELAIGLGETLVSAEARGTPYRLVWDKDSGEVTVLAFANFSSALRVAPNGGAVDELVDYSTIELSRNFAALSTLANRLGRIAALVEKDFGKPMDIEGAVVGNDVYLVQARPQQGLGASDRSATGTRPKFAGDEATGPSSHRKDPANQTLVTSSPAKHGAVELVILGLFEKRIDGDDSLLELARLRFEQTGLGAEVHAGTPEQLEAVLRFQPASRFRPVVHLPREFNLADSNTRERIRILADRLRDGVYGLLLHDRAEWEHQPHAFVDAARQMESELQRSGNSPFLFVEYAAGLEWPKFADLFRSIQELKKVTVAIDVGHVGIRTVRTAYARLHPGQDICALKAQPPELPRLMADVDQAVSEALPAVLRLVSALGELGKPIHFHLHDGHPLSAYSPYGVADHLSFQAEIPLNFEHDGRRAVSPMYGPAGLEQIVRRALESLPAERLSFTLEIHPTQERRPLGNAAHLFAHWRDKTHAELMNHWLAVLAQNQQLLLAGVNPPVGKH